MVKPIQYCKVKYSEKKQKQKNKKTHYFATVFGSEKCFASISHFLKSYGLKEWFLQEIFSFKNYKS